MCQINFCVKSESFQYDNSTKEEICEKLFNFLQLKKKIEFYKDLIFYKDDLYQIDLYNNKKIHQILYQPNEIFSHDCKELLIEIIKLKHHTNEEIKKNIGLNKIEEDIICITDELMSFYYEYMQNIKDEDIFSNILKKYFNNLVFQEKINDSLKTLDGGLEYFSRDIVKSLTYLNDNFKQILIQENSNVRKALIKLSSLIGLEATIEGDITRKTNFTFKFVTDNKTVLDICCEPHIKLSKSSKNGDHTHYFNRIYFHVGKNEINNGNILIGHIGKHL